MCPPKGHGRGRFINHLRGEATASLLTKRPLVAEIERHARGHNQQVTVATTYSIKIEGTKRTVNQSGLTSDKLLAWVNVAVEVGPGATVRGQVLAGETKKMVWIAQEPGSHIPGHWAEAGSKEAASHNSQVLNANGMKDFMNRNNPNMTDPTGPSSSAGR